MVTAVILLALGLGGLAAGILVGRYYVPDDRALKRSARHAQAYVKTINLLLARERDAAVDELVHVVAENVADVEPYFALGALFRARGEWERAIRVHQAIELREKGNRSICLRARYELGLDFRSAGMPRRATRAMEECIHDDPKHTGGLRALCGLYEEQGRFAEAAMVLQRLAKLDVGGDPDREHHLLCAAAQRAIERDDLPSAKRLLRDARQGEHTSPHLHVASAEYAAAKGDWKHASLSLRQALVARPELVSYLAGPLRAAELELHAGDDGAEGSQQEATRQTITALEEVESTTGDEPLVALALAELHAELNGEDALSEIRVVADENPELLPARVAAGRLALESGDASSVSRELKALVGDDGALDWAKEGTWRCGACGRQDEYFFWRCEGCRKWGRARLDLGPALREPMKELRERRLRPRSAGLLAGDSLPASSLISGMSQNDLDDAASQHSALTRAGKWITGAIGSVRGHKRDDDAD